MYPYVKADLEAGRETEASIVERLTNLWIKTITINKVRSQAHTFSSAGSPLYQNVTIGGQTRDKRCSQPTFLPRVEIWPKLIFSAESDRSLSCWLGCSLYE